MLQELRNTVAAATQLVAEIGLRFKTGEAADELLARLDATIATLAQQAAGVENLPDDLRDEITQLLALVQEAVTTGDDWLARTGPEVASQYVRQRLNRAYGVP